MKKVAEELARIIEELKGIAIAEYCNLDDPVECLDKMRDLMKYSEYDCVDFLKLAETEKTYQTWVERNSEGGITRIYEPVSLAEIRKYYTDCVDARTEFDGEYLKLIVFWEEDDLFGNGYRYVIKVWK